jgi:hypothetical protein
MCDISTYLRASLNEETESAAIGMVEREVAQVMNRGYTTLVLMKRCYRG